MFLRRFQGLAYTDLHQCLPHRWRDVDTITLPSLKEAFEVLELFYRVHYFRLLPRAMNRHLGGGIDRDPFIAISVVHSVAVSPQRVLGREQRTLRRTSLAKQRVSV